MYFVLIVVQGHLRHTIHFFFAKNEGAYRNRAEGDEEQQ
jgi:hypothetical protein